MSSVDELTLRGDELEIVVLPGIGGRIHRIRAFGADLLRTPPHAARHLDEPIFWGAYPMAPWCNRAVAGTTEVAGKDVRLVPNSSDGTAIHGLVLAAPWTSNADASMRVEAGGDGWPWRHEVSVVPRVAGRTLELAYRLINHADSPMPAGLGLHPWFRRPVEVRLPAEAVYDANSGSPREPHSVAGSFDLRSLAEPSGGLDATWTRLRERRIELRWRHLGVSAILEMESDATSACVALASPPSIDAVAIEPQTHGPDPLRRLTHGEPDAPILLRPGGELRLIIRLTVVASPA